MLSEETAAGLLGSIGIEAVLDVVFTVSVYIGLGSLLKTFNITID